jgi:hypothetical protein
MLHGMRMMNDMLHWDLLGSTRSWSEWLISSNAE